MENADEAPLTFDLSHVTNVQPGWVIPSSEPMVFTDCWFADMRPSIILPLPGFGPVQ